MPTSLSSLLFAVLLPAAAPAQGLPVTYITDSGDDVVFRLTDLDADGDYNDAGEVVVFYDETLGTITLGNNVGIGVAADGVVYVCDGSSDIVLALEDTDADGECNDPGEHRVFFDGNPGGNASGIEMSSALNLLVDGPRIWIANANNGAGGIDQVFTIEDLDLDGDANDAGEAATYYAPPTTGSTGDSIVQDVKLGLDGNVYYLETGSTGLYAKGVYLLEDLDASGDIDPTSEVSPFFIPPALGSNPFFWGFDQGPDGAWYMADTSNELVWRFRDDDADGTITNGVEESIWWAAPGSTFIWQVHATSDGSLYCAESQAPDRVLVMLDANGDGQIDPGSEVTEVYDETVAPVAIGNPRGLFVVEPAEPGVAYCYGDGSARACPCGNESAEQTGCLNSTGAGVLLEAAGEATVGADTLVLFASGGPATQPGLFFQGDNATNGAQGQPFGDGLRCAGGNVVRLEVVPTDGAGAAASTVTISVKGGVSAGETKRYQYWYRDPMNGPCGSTFNLSNGYEIVWS